MTSRIQLYNQTKQLTLNLGKDLTEVKRRYQGSNKTYWKRQVADLTNEIKLRDGNFNRALKVSRENREPLSREASTYGTDNNLWKREVRRLRMRGRRKPGELIEKQQRLNPIVNAIKERNEQVLEQQRLQRERAIRAEINLKKQQNRLINAFINRDKYNELLKLVVSKKIKMTIKQATKLYNSIINKDGKYSIVYTLKNGTPEHRPIKELTKNFIINLLTNGLLSDEKDTFGSDTLTELDIQEVINIRIEEVKVDRILKNKNGDFFPFINETELDLTKYQIYNEEDIKDIIGLREELRYDRTGKERKDLIESGAIKKDQDRIEHCLIHTLKQLTPTISVNKIKDFQLSFKNNVSVARRHLYIVANFIKRIIFLHEIDKRGKEKITKYMPTEEIDDEQTIEYLSQTELNDLIDAYNTKRSKICGYTSDKRTADDRNGRIVYVLKYEEAHIAIHNNHYFKYEKTEYSRLYIKNYRDLQDKERGEDIFKIRKNGSYVYSKNDSTKITSLRLVDEFFKQGKFIKHNCLLELSEYREEEEEDIIVLSEMDIEANQKLIEIKKKKKSKSCNIFYADCEAFVSGERHELYMLGVANNDNDNVVIFNNKRDNNYAVKNCLDYLTCKGTKGAIVYFHNLKYDFNLLESNLNIIDKCEKDGMIYSVKVNYKKQHIIFKDSLKMIPMRLGDFSKVFNLGDNFSKKEAINYRYYTHENCDVEVDVNVYKEGLPYREREIFDENIKTNKFNPEEYYKEYLQMDCLVLKKGMQKFNSIITEITEGKINMYDYLTVSSLTDTYFKNNGAYDGVYEISGVLRKYISQAVYGGRVHVNDKYLKQKIEGKIADFDGVSLYPSAINRLCRERGLPTGEARKLTDFGNWKNYNYSIMTVKITKVNKHQQMPMIAHKLKDSIKYYNKAPVNPVVIDSITLEDYINFHDIEYEILDGIYYEDDGNKTMGKLVQDLFNNRLEYKKSNQPLAQVIKLMLNSAYGKTITKKTKTKTSFKSNDAYKNYLYNNFETINKVRKPNKYQYEIEQASVDLSYNRGAVGVAILSMSKRIMNEVFDVANTHNLPIYYTDTDSLHCNVNDLDKLEYEYNNKYQRELVGKQLEQFHTDFNLDGADSEIYAIRSYFLGKKSYLDVLETIDKWGNKINGHHVRLKGITKEGIDHAGKIHRNGIEGVFQDLIEGKTIVFILNPFDEEKNKEKVLFEFKNGIITTKTEFTRSLKF